MSSDKLKRSKGSQWQPVNSHLSKRTNLVHSRQQQHHVLVTGTAPASAWSASLTYSQDNEERRKEELLKRERTQLQHPMK